MKNILDKCPIKWQDAECNQMHHTMSDSSAPIPAPDTTPTPASTLPPTNPVPQPSNALAIWALVMGLVCCAPVGVVLGIIGINKYPRSSAGWIMSLIALIVGGLSIVVSSLMCITDPDVFYNSL